MMVKLIPQFHREKQNRSYLEVDKKINKNESFKSLGGLLQFLFFSVQHLLGKNSSRDLSNKSSYIITSHGLDSLLKLEIRRDKTRENT